MVAMPTRHSGPIIAALAGFLLAASAQMSSPASAEPETSLTSAVDAARGSCPPLRSDPLVVRAAQLANRGTADYITHRSAASPVSDPMPALRTVGYAGSKARLLSGYGTNERDAIHGLVVQGYKTIPDCSFTQYGADVHQEEGFVLTSVILAAP